MAVEQEAHLLDLAVTGVQVDVEHDVRPERGGGVDLQLVGTTEVLARG